jgi:uncharacterized protein YjbI with pentapeptide repeats
MKGADLRGAEIKHARFSRTDLKDAILRDAADNPFKQNRSTDE